MISIVVPVVWGYEPFCNFLLDVVQLPIIEEVILINNNVKKTPEHDVLSHQKVHVYNQEENIFVNPAWNLGVSLAKNDKICILTDDILVDLRAFLAADRFIRKEIGLLSIGIHFDLFKAQNAQYDDVKYKNLIVSGDLKIKASEDNPNNAGRGSLFFLHKENWIDIPNDLKIYWGDTWQYDIQMGLGRKNYFINDCFYYSPWNVASKIGVGCEYQTTDEFKKFENREYYNELLSSKLQELRNVR